MPRGIPKNKKKTGQVTLSGEPTVIRTEPEQVVTKVVLMDKAVLNRQKTSLNPTPNDVYQQAEKLVQMELINYQETSLGLRDTIIRAYKNYLGVYDEPYDTYTSRKKIFSSLTHDNVDAVSRPVDITAKSIRIKPKTEESRGAAKVLNMILPYFFQEMGFDEMVRLFVHRVGWLGSQVTVQDWLYEEMEVSDDNQATEKKLVGFPDKEEPSKTTVQTKSDKPRIRLVNLLDLYVPVNAESLPWAVKNASVILRSQCPLTDVIANPAYDETAKVSLSGTTYESADSYNSTTLNKYANAGFRFGEAKSMDGNQQPRSFNPFVSIYERYGMIPKSWISGDPKDALINVPGIVTTASNEASGNIVKTLSVRLSPFGEYGPFEEAHYNKLPNRWYGEGIGERLIPLQAWHNEVINTRRNNEILVQQKMFIYRKGKVDPRQLFSRPGGGIGVENMDDIQPLPTPDVSQSSFVEDSNIQGAAQRLSGAALTPIQKQATATEITNIQANANLTFSELKQTSEKYLERLVLHHLLPLLKRYFKQKRMIPVEMSISDLQVLDSYNGYPPFITEKLGNERFLLVDDTSIFEGDFAVTVDIEDERTSRDRQIAALTNGIGLASKIQDSGLNIKKAVRKIMELSGIYDDRLFEDATVAAPTGVTNPQMVSQPPQAAQNAPMPNFGAMGA